MSTPPSPPQLGADGLIVEGLLSTVNVDGSAHFSPMGPIVDHRLERLWLRPFQTSRAYQNLKRTGQGVFHITDDVELLARAAIGRLDRLPPTTAANAVTGAMLTNACRWYALEVESIDDASDRANIVGRVVDQGVQREFFGFNRAKHAVIEAAILATRLHLVPPDEVNAEFDRLAAPVAKTGGAAERRAFDLLREYIRDPANRSSTTPSEGRR